MIEEKMPSKTTVYAGCITKAVAVACAMFSTPSVMAHASNSAHDHGYVERDLPADLRARLPNRTDDAIRQIVGNDVILIQKGTELILDVISDVVRN